MVNLKRFLMVLAVVVFSGLFLTGCGKMYTLSVTQNPANGGTVLISPTGPRYKSGTIVTITAIPADGWTFVGWSGDASGSTNALTVRMDGDRSIEARFEQEQPEDNTWTVSGTVKWKGYDGDNVAGALVTLGGQSVSTDEFGSFTFTGSLDEPGGATTAELVVTHPLTNEYRTTVNLTNGPAVNVELLMILHVNPQTGDDTSDGSADHPLKTIGKAVSGQGERRILLAEGTYSATSGESFPIWMGGSYEIIGNESNPASCSIVGSEVNLIRERDAHVQFKGIRFAGNGTYNECAYLEGGVVGFSHCAFDCTGIMDGVEATASCELTVSDCAVTASTGVSVAQYDFTGTGRTRAYISNTDFTNCAVAIRGDDVNHQGGTSFEIHVTNCSIVGDGSMTSSGIAFYGQRSTYCGHETYGALTVDNVSISQVWLGIESTGGAIRLRNSQITGTHYGLYLTKTVENGALNMGRTGEPGGNTLTGNEWWGVYDDRNADMGVIWAVGNTFKTIHTGTVTSADADTDGDFKICSSGNSIVFSE